jgi:hypothetical protein
VAPPSRFAAGLFAASFAAGAFGCGAAADPPEQSAITGHAGETDGTVGRPDAFEITVGRRLHAGERFRLDRREKVDRTVRESVNGAAPVEERTVRETSFSATGEVEAVDDEGNERAYVYLVQRFARSDEEGTWGLPHGTKIHVVRGETEASAVVTVDGVPARPEVREAIGIFVAFTADGVDDDVLFGTSKPRRVGERWEAREDLVRQALERRMTVPEDAVSASAALVGVHETPEGWVRELRTDIAVEGFELAGMAPQVEFGDTKLTSTAQMELGPDGRLLSNRSRRRLEVDVTFAPTGGAVRAVEIVEETTYESRNVPLGP